jgi:hypothetical protein
MDPLLTVIPGTFTVMVETTELVQPVAASVPTTGNVLVFTGLTTGPPNGKVKLEAPVGFIVNEFPTQMLPLLTLTFGKALTLTEHTTEL